MPPSTTFFPLLLFPLLCLHVKQYYIHPPKRHILIMISHSHTLPSLIFYSHVLTCHRLMWENIEFIFSFSVLHHLSFLSVLSAPLLHCVVCHPISSVMLFSNKRHNNFCLILMAAHTTIRETPAVQRRVRASRGPGATTRCARRPPPPPPPPGEHACVPWR